MSELGIIWTENERGSIRNSVNQIADIMLEQVNLAPSIYVKANMYKSPFQASIGTHPVVIDELVKRLEKEGKNVWWGDIQCVHSPGLDQYSPELKSSKYIDLNRETDVEYLELDDSLVVGVPSFLLSDDWSIINVPVLKSHSEAYLSACMKNMMGLLPRTSDRENIHRFGLSINIRKLYDALAPHIVFNIVDAVFSHQGNGPIHGESVLTNHLFYGKDGLSIDAYLSGLIDSDHVVPYIERERVDSASTLEKPFSLKSANLLDEIHYSGNAGVEFLGLLSTVHDEISAELDSDVHFVFEGGQAQPGKINIGVNNYCDGCDLFLDGQPPSRREIRRVLNLEETQHERSAGRICRSYS